MPMTWQGPKLPPGVSATPGTPKKDGSVTWYFYHKPTKTKLLQQPGTTAFEREVARAAAGGEFVPVIKPENLSDICDKFERSTDHTNCAATTRLNRERVLKDVRVRWGNFTNAAMSDKRWRGDIRDWRDSMKATPSMADYSIQTLQRVIAWAYEGGSVDVNHTLRIKRLSDMRPREGMGLTSKQIDALFAVGGEDEIQLFKFALYTGMRKADLCRVEWSNMDEDGVIKWLHTKTAKTTKAVSFYPTTVLTPLDNLIRSLPRRNSTNCMLTTRTGIPWSPWNIGLRWQRWLERAGLKPTAENPNVPNADIHFHDIRRQCIQNMLEANCTNAQSASISGHRITDGADAGGFGIYAARSLALAEQAYKKLDLYMTPASNNKKVVNLRRK